MYLGKQLVQNGLFLEGDEHWTLGEGWSVSNNELVHEFVWPTITRGVAAQDIEVAAGHRYNVTLRITSAYANRLIVKIGDTEGPVLDDTGSYIYHNFEIVAGSEAGLEIRPERVQSGTTYTYIHSITVEEIFEGRATPYGVESIGGAVDITRIVDGSEYQG